MGEVAHHAELGQAGYVRVGQGAQHQLGADSTWIPRRDQHPRLAHRPSMTGQGPAPAGGYLLGLDAGTGSCRAVLFDPAGRETAVAQREWSHPPVRGINGSQDFGWAGHWALICVCIREVLGSVADPAAVLAVGCSGMGGGLVLYGRDGREVWACANGDARARQQAESWLASGTAARLYQLGGGWITLTAPPRLDWVRQHQPGEWASVTRLSMIADWMVYRLTGALVTEASIGSSSGLFDLDRRTWSPELLDLCGLPPTLFPEVVAAGTIVGRISPAAARQTGLATTTEVVAGGLDTALGLAAARRPPGQLTVTGGSFWKHTVLADRAAVEPGGRLRTICHVHPGQWLVEGIGFYAGLALRWLRDIAAAHWPAGQAPGYPELERLASAVPAGSGGVLAGLAPADAWTWARWQPPFGPVPADLDPQARRAELAARARAIEEAAAYSARRSAELLGALLGVRFGEVVLTGGAARSTLWPEILADVLGLPVRLPRGSESAAAGAAALAGRAIGLPVAAGLTDTAGPATAATAAGSVANPSPAQRQAYDLLYAQWRGRPDPGPGWPGRLWRGRDQ
jgi:autoinducer 2 (AI-2) kinase